jgi:hypothetical protein
MKILSQIKSSFRAIFHKEKLDPQLDEEMRSQLEMQTRESIEAGMNPEAARYAALRQFGWDLKTQRSPRRFGYRRQVAKMTQLRGNRSIQHGREIIGHDNRICPKARTGGFQRIKSNKHPAPVAAPGQIAGDHGKYDLGYSSVQIIGLHDQGRPFLERGYVRIRKPHQNHIAPFKARHKLPSREPTNPPPMKRVCREDRQFPDSSSLGSPRFFFQMILFPEMSLTQILRANPQPARLTVPRPLYNFPASSCTCIDGTQPAPAQQAQGKIASIGGPIDPHSSDRGQKR